MRVLLDEMLPIGVAGLLPDHTVTSVKAAGYAGLKNGELIRRATADRYDVLVTADRNMPSQQTIRASGIAIVLVPGNRVSDIQPKAAAIQSAVMTARPGTVTRLGRTG